MSQANLCERLKSSLKYKKRHLSLSSPTPITLSIQYAHVCANWRFIGTHKSPLQISAHGWYPIRLFCTLNTKRIGCGPVNSPNTPKGYFPTHLLSCDTPCTVPTPWSRKLFSENYSEGVKKTPILQLPQINATKSNKSNNKMIKQIM